MVLFSAPRVRRAIRVLLGLLALAVAGDLIVRLIGFANLFGFFRPHSGIVVTQREVLDAYNNRNNNNGSSSSSSGNDPAVVVPRILHQVYHNWTDPDVSEVHLPADWEAARQSCLDRNPDWEYRLWSAAASREFIEDEFPWFLPTYDGYRFPVQRVDVIRYFALRHFGGIYIDLDNGCAEPLDALTVLPAFTTDGGHGTLSNNIIGGQPGHPFFELLTESLTAWDWNWILPYVVVSYTSGQWFVTAMWERYHGLLGADGTVRGFASGGGGGAGAGDGPWAPLHHILMDVRPGAPDPFVIWTQERGGTWDQWDSAWFGWIGNHVALVVSEVVGALVVALLLLWCCVRGCFYCVRRRSSSRRGYKAVDSHEPESA